MTIEEYRNCESARLEANRRRMEDDGVNFNKVTDLAFVTDNTARPDISEWSNASLRSDLTLVYI